MVHRQELMSSMDDFRGMRAAVRVKPRRCIMQSLAVSTVGGEAGDGVTDG